MKTISLTLVAALTAACSSTPAQPPRASVTTVGAQTASLDQAQTFGFGPANPPAAGFDVTPRALEVQRRLSALVESALEKRGLSHAADNPDLVVKVSAGSGAEDQKLAGRGNETETTPRGFISIDVYDAETGAGLWHGTGQADINPSTIDDALLASAVEGILARFPTRTESQ